MIDKPFIFISLLCDALEEPAMICQSFRFRRNTCFLLAFVAATICLGGFAVQASAWTQPVAIQENATQSQIAPAGDGGVHVAYFIDYEVWYARRDAAGNWSSPEHLANFFSFRPAVLEDAQGRPHVFFPGDGDGG